MADKIEALYLCDATNGAVFEFLKEAIARARADEGVCANAADELAALDRKFGEYDKVLVLSYKSKQSDKIKEYDKNKGQKLFGVKAGGKALCTHLHRRAAFRLGPDDKELRN